MDVTLYTQNLIDDIRNKSHYEVASIADDDARYRAEAGTEKLSEIKRCIQEAIGRLTHRLYPYLNEAYTFDMTDDLDVPTDSAGATTHTAGYKFEFDMSERRADGKKEPLRNAMHSFVVHYALSFFYSTVSQSELSNKHGVAALEEANHLDEIIYTKKAPR